MSHRAVAALAETLRGHVGLGKSRLETLSMLVVGMIGARTVNLGHIATAARRGVLIASTCRRLQRFFQHVALDPDWAVAIIARLRTAAATSSRRRSVPTMPNTPG